MNDETTNQEPIVTPAERNIRLDVEYDGRNYRGWQWQPDGKTIEKSVKNAVETVVNHPVKLLSCGRTDAGVHAEQHVAQFFTTSNASCFGIMQGLNKLLPDDIAVYSVSEMHPKWTARHSPYEREYRYTYWCSQARSVHFFHRSHWVFKNLDVVGMNQAAAYLVGEHDFSAFRSSHCGAEHAVRHIFECRVIDQTPLVHLKIRGTAFLRHQVRTIAGTLLKVGQGKIPPDYMKVILESKDRNLAAQTLSAHGLTLVAVRYHEDADLNLHRPSVFHVD
jgi:tRNA pseudouridine38-40 synthase